MQSLMYGLPMFLGEVQDLIGQFTFDDSSVFNSLNPTANFPICQCLSRSRTWSPSRCCTSWNVTSWSLADAASALLETSFMNVWRLEVHLHPMSESVSTSGHGQSDGQGCAGRYEA